MKSWTENVWPVGKLKKKWLISVAKLKHLPLHNELEKLNTRSFQNGARSYKDAKQGYDYIERNGVYLDNIWSSLCGHIDHNWCYFIAVLYKFISASASHEQKKSKINFYSICPPRGSHLFIGEIQFTHRCWYLQSTV